MTSAPATRSRSGFPLLAAAHAASAATDAAVAVALASTLFFSVPLGEARGQVALYLLVTLAPFSVLAPLVGPALDRHPGSYRYGMFAAALARALLCVVLVGRTGGFGLFPLAFGLLVASRVHSVSRAGLVPSCLPADRALIWGNGRLALIASATGALTAGVAVGLAKLGGPDPVLYLAALAAAAGTVAALDLPRPPPLPATGAADPDAPRRPRFTDLPVRVVAAGTMMATLRATVGYLTFFLAFLLREAGEGGIELGLVVAVAMGGALVGAIVGPPLRRLLPELGLLLALLGLVAVAAGWAAYSGGLGFSALAAGTVGLATGAGRLAFDSVVQGETPVAVRGRAFTRYETIFQGCWVLGAAVALLPVGRVIGFTIVAVGCLSGGVVGTRRLRRTRA